MSISCEQDAVAVATIYRDHWKPFGTLFVACIRVAASKFNDCSGLCRNDRFLGHDVVSDITVGYKADKAEIFSPKVVGRHDAI